MTLPMWSPFALLVVACSLYPKPHVPRWIRAVDWLAVAALLYMVAAWSFVAFLTWWLVW
jgi:hypothetical protein